MKNTCDAVVVNSTTGVTQKGVMKIMRWKVPCKYLFLKDVIMMLVLAKGSLQTKYNWPFFFALGLASVSWHRDICANVCSSLRCIYGMLVLMRMTVTSGEWWWRGQQWHLDSRNELYESFVRMMRRGKLPSSAYAYVMVSVIEGFHC